MDNIAWLALFNATVQTIYMVFIASSIGVIVGLIIGLLLFLTAPNKALSNCVLHHGLGWVVNATRSVPFIILLVAILPLTQWIVGTSIGTNAAIVPLSLAAIPFFARLCEAAFSEVSPELFETSDALGANTWQLVRYFLLPESLSALIKGGTLTVIGLIGYSAMAGAVGGGGLGELAINYGYERFDVIVMIETVVLLIILVQGVQFLGDYLARTRRLKLLLGIVIIFSVVCMGYQLWPIQTTHAQTIKVGVISGEDVTLLKVANREAVKRFGLHIKTVAFNDYIQPNVALNNGSIDANIFQHVPYLNAQIKAHGYHLTPIAKTFVYPFGFYSRKIKSLDQLKVGSVIAIPNDPSNEGRALLLLSHAHLVGLKPHAGLFPNPRDIILNPKKLHFVEMNAAQIARSLNDVDLGGLTNDYAKPAGFIPKQAVLLEGPDSPYANVIVVRTSNLQNPLLKQLVKVIHSKAYLQATLKAFPNGAAIAAFNPDK